jgi:D-3-phosphoglycerate dehydrogenase
MAERDHVAIEVDLPAQQGERFALPWAGEGRWAELRTSIILAQRAASLARALLADRGVRTPRRLTVRTGGELAGAREMLASAAALGVLHDIIETERLNLINARALAEARGIELALGEISDPEQPSQIEVSLDGGTQEMCVAGAAPPGSTPRISRIGAFHVDVAPRNTLIILTNNDVPGVIGRVGTLLGDAGVNIAEYHQARLAQGGDALAAISVDSVVTPELRRRLLDIPEVLTATVVRFDDAGSHAIA